MPFGGRKFSCTKKKNYHSCIQTPPFLFVQKLFYDIVTHPCFILLKFFFHT